MIYKNAKNGAIIFSIVFLLGGFFKSRVCLIENKYIPQTFCGIRPSPDNQRQRQTWVLFLLLKWPIKLNEIHSVLL